MSGRPTRRQVTSWADELSAVGERIGGRFARSEPRRRAVGYVRGLLSGTERDLARRRIGRAVDAGVPGGWVAGDAVYGSGYTFRAALERRGLGYVLGVRTDQAVCVGWRHREVRALLPQVPATAWHRLS